MFSEPKLFGIDFSLHFAKIKSIVFSVIMLLLRFIVHISLLSSRSYSWPYYSSKMDVINNEAPLSVSLFLTSFRTLNFLFFTMDGSSCINPSSPKSLKKNIFCHFLLPAYVKSALSVRLF